MKPLVVDTSVAVKWFLPEIHFEAAGKALKHELLAPDIIWAEFGNALLKKVRRQELGAQKAHEILKDFIRFPLTTYSSKSILNAAWHIAQQTKNSIYDNLYLALAVNRNCDLVTADRKFYGSLNAKFVSRVVWIENI